MWQCKTVACSYCRCFVLADDDGTSRTLMSLRTKQCIKSIELSSNAENAERFDLVCAYLI